MMHRLALFLLFALGRFQAHACPSPQQYEGYLRRFNNGTQPLGKRWFSVEAPDSLFWPNARVPYCIDGSWDEEYVEALEETLRNAWAAWVDAGVDGDTLSMVPGSSTECNGDITKFLFIQKAKDDGSGALWTTVGTGILGDGNTGGAEMSIPESFVDVLMSIDEEAEQDADEAFFDIVHEIGHVWGLLHEHQRPSLWDRHEYPDGTGHTQKVKFTCSNLADFEEMAQGRTGDRIHQACTQYSQTKFPDIPQFSASEFLPMPSMQKQEYTEDGALPLDTESIMLYPSTTFGKQLSQDTDAIVITGPNNEIFPKSPRSPSTNDVRNLNLMYNGNAYTEDGYQPFFYPASQFRSIYQASLSCNAYGYIVT